MLLGYPGHDRQLSLRFVLLIAVALAGTLAIAFGAAARSPWRPPVSDLDRRDSSRPLSAPFPFA